MEKPRLELPQRVAVSRPMVDRASALILVVCLAGFGGVAWLLTRPTQPANKGGAAGTSLSPDQIEQIALRLEDRNLCAAAADAWRDYLAAANPPLEREARIRAQMGRLLQKGGRYEEAVACFYRAEALAGPKKELVGEDVATRVRDCFREMGRYGELAREVESRASIAAKPGELAGQQIVAEIGSEKITAADLDRMWHDEIENLLAGAAGAPAGQVEEMRRRAREQFARPEARAQFLEQRVVRRVLATEARRRKLDQDAAFRARLVDEADNLLAAQLLSTVAAGRAAVTPADVERFYAANRKQYEVPAFGGLARIVCKEKADAEKVIELLDGGATFEKLAADRSVDEGTKSAGGRLDEPIRPESGVVPGVGKDRALHEKLWRMKEGRYTKEPCQVGEAWHVYRMVEKTDARTPGLDEIRDRVEAECRQARREEVTRQFVQELFREHDVRLHRSAIPATQATNGGSP